MKGKIIQLLALLMVASLILTACGGAAPEEPAPAEPAEPAATEASEEPAAPAMEEQTVVIGFTSSLTGSQEVNSKRQVDGFNLWLEQVNVAGGVTLSDGTVIKFASHTYDDESNGERVQELYTRLITEDGADFLISPYSSGLTSAASIVAEQNGVVMVTAGAADDDAYKTGNTSLFQLYTPGSLYMSSTVDMLKELDPEAKVALVHESDKFSTGVAEGIKPYLEANGFEIVLEEGYASDTADFGPIVNKIAGSGATVLLGGGHYNDGTALARAIYDRKIGLKLVYLLVAPADTKFPELGDAALGVATSSQWELAATHTEEEAANMSVEWFGPTGDEFASTYEAAYGSPPTYHSAGGYTAGLVLQKAIMDADSVDSEAVREALNNMDIMTFYGHIKFDTSDEAHGLQIAHKMVVAQWQKNDAGELERVIVAPGDVATADPLYPIPVP
jgi:ABC-type branched-subunit amino acid transport system substrate-binding protein